MTVTALVELLDRESDPRERLLIAGALLLNEDGHGVLETGLSPERVTRRAGRSRRTFYDHFESKRQYVEALYERFLFRGDMPADRGDRFVEGVDAMFRGPSGQGLAYGLRSLGDAYIAQYSASPVLPVQLTIGLLAHSDPQVKAAIDADLDLSDELNATLFNGLTETWGVAPRPPWTAERFSQMLRALADGIWLHRTIRGDTIDPAMLADVIVTMYPTLLDTSAAGSPAPIDAAVHDLGVELAMRWQEHSDPASVVNARERVHQVLPELLLQSGYAGLSMEELAARSGVSLRTIVRAMGSKEELIASLFRDYITGLDSALELDEANAKALGPLEILDRHLVRLFDFTRMQKPMAMAIGVLLLETRDMPMREAYLELVQVTERAIESVMAAVDAVQWQGSARGLAHIAVDLLFADIAVASDAPGIRTRRLVRQLLEPHQAVQRSTNGSS